MRIRYAVLVFVVALSVCNGLQATIVTTTPFRGITDSHVSENDGTTYLDYHLVKIDLHDPGIRFQTTAAISLDRPHETYRQTTRDFVRQTGAQVGINANFYNAGTPPGPIATLVGMAASAGNVLERWDGFDQGLNFPEAGGATFIQRDPSDPNNLASLPAVTPYNVISGNYLLVEAKAEGDFSGVDPTPQPRTAAGLDGDGNLILMIVDGRNSGHSDGMSVQALAHAMRLNGAVNAINLDGGGSTTLVFADNTPRVVNVPVGIGNVPTTERANGNNLAIFAVAIPEPSAVSIGVLIVLISVGCGRCRSTIRSNGDRQQSLSF